MELTLLKLGDAAKIHRLQEKQKTASAKEAVAPELFSLVAGDSEDAKFRRITAPATMRDLNPAMHERMQQVCFFLFMTTPFGRRIIRVMVDYVVGEGFKPIAEDPQVQEVIDRFWKHPRNNMAEMLDTYAVETLVFGELCLPTAVNPVDGFVTLGFADRVRLLNSFVWHYIAKGADETQVNKLRDKVMKSPPRQGGVEVTNDQISIEARTPDLKGSDMIDADRVVKNYGLGGAGLPPWFFADAGNTNRATADEMAGPTGKMLTSRQNIFRRMTTQILDYVIEQAVTHGVLSRTANLAYQLQVPDLRVKDMVAASTALQTIANAAGTGEDRGWIRPETAARLFITVMTQIGVEVDADEFDEAQAAKTARDASQQNALDPQANLADALKKAKALKDMAPATEVTQ